MEQAQRVADNFIQQKFFYAQGRAPSSKPPLELRLIFSAKNCQYVFIDTGKGGALKRTRILIHTDKYGNFSLEEKDLNRFITFQTGRNYIKIRSFELKGGY